MAHLNISLSAYDITVKCSSDDGKTFKLDLFNCNGKLVISTSTTISPYYNVEDSSETNEENSSETNEENSSETNEENSSETNEENSSETNEENSSETNDEESSEFLIEEPFENNDEEPSETPVEEIPRITMAVNNNFNLSEEDREHVRKIKHFIDTFVTANVWQKRIVATHLLEYITNHCIDFVKNHNALKNTIIEKCYEFKQYCCPTDKLFKVCNNFLTEVNKTVSEPDTLEYSCRANLLKSICSKKRIEYTNELLIEYSKWNETLDPNIKLNRYKKMIKFISERA
jgi:hypothetical protein